MPSPLSTAMRDLLIDHIDGPVGLNVSDCHRYNRVRGAIAQGYLSWTGGVIRPKGTELTDRGKMALCQALAEWADALIKARDSRDALFTALLDQAVAADAARTPEIADVP
jgi:hypothetical protein